MNRGYGPANRQLVQETGSRFRVREGPAEAEAGVVNKRKGVGSVQGLEKSAAAGEGAILNGEDMTSSWLVFVSVS